MRALSHSCLAKPSYQTSILCSIGECYAALVRGEGEAGTHDDRKPLEWLLYHLQTSINQSCVAPLLGASLSVSKFKKQIMSVQKSLEIKKHIHKTSVLLTLRILSIVRMSPCSI
jgi:hypothetical protein